MIELNNNDCIGGHHWTYSASPDYKIPEGTPCDCGQVKYKKPKYCSQCGHILDEQANQK